MQRLDPGDEAVEDEHDVGLGEGPLHVVAEEHRVLGGHHIAHGERLDHRRGEGVGKPRQRRGFVRADSSIKSIADLKGKPMVDGYTAQNTILPQLDAMYATAGLSRSDMRPVKVPSVVAGADAFISGDSVGFIFAHGAGKVREADASVGGLRALPIPNTPENVHAIKQHWPVAYLTEMKPNPNSPGVEKPGWFMAYPQIVFTHKDVPDAVVYKMAKVLYEHKDAMTATFAPFVQFDPKRMVGDAGAVPYHEGAIRFFKDIGLWKK